MKKNKNVASLQELSLKEMQEVNGGSWVSILKWVERLGILGAACDAYDELKSGWNEAGDSCEFKW